MDRDVLRRLAAVRRKRSRVEALNGLLRSLAVSAGMALVFLLIESIIPAPSPVRTAAFWAVLGTCAVLLVPGTVVPLLRLAGILRDEPDEETASRVGAAFPGVRDRLMNALQLQRERGRGLYSDDLIDASLSDISANVSGVDFLKTVPTGRMLRTAQALGALAAVGVLLVTLFPGTFLEAGRRLINYGEAYAAAAPFRLIVTPGNREVVRGESVQITIEVDGARLPSLVLESRPAGQAVYDVRDLVPGQDGTFRHEFQALRSTTTYRARARSVVSDEFMLTVLDRPAVRLLRVLLTPPSYTGLPPRQLDDNVGDMTALRGTRAAVSVESNKELAAAALVFGDSSRLPLAVSGRTGNGTATLRREGTYQIDLVASDGTTSADPVQYTIRLVSDAFPAAAIPLPGRNVSVVDDTSLALAFKITDDFGFSSLRLAYRLAQSRYEQAAEQFTYLDVPLPAANATELTVPYLWPLRPLALAPEDVVQYYVEVFDNDRVSGPKSAVSETYTLRLPSLEEVTSRVEQGHEASLETMREALKQAEEARREMEELRRDLAREQDKQNWQTQKKAEEAVRQYEEAQKKIEGAAQMVDELTQEMQQHRLLSQETLAKYQELQSLMQQMNSPELAEALKRLQQAMQQMNPDALRQAMQQFQMTEETFRKSIERTINLLKRIQVEQKLDAMLKEIDEIAARQEALAKETERTGPTDTRTADGLSERQRDLADDARRLEEDAEELQKAMQEFPREMPTEEMQEAEQQLSESGLRDDMQESEASLQRRQMDAAAQSQRSAAEKLRSFGERMHQVQRSMRQNQQQQVVNEMRRSLQDLLTLSDRQEAMRAETRGLEQNSPQFRDMAQRQMEATRDLSSVTERMAGLSQKTFGITPEMGKALGDAMRSMGNAVQSLDDRNGNAATGQQSAALGSLNEAARMMQATLGAMMQGEGAQGMGMAGLMQRLQQMSGQQQGINEGTRQLGGMSPQQAAEYGRLAAEQGLVRKSMEQLAREAAASGALSRMLGDLQRAAQEMREVQTDLARGSVTPETLRKQERILSRLLDSQRSMRERDYEQRRQAETGRNVARTGPESIDPSTVEGRDRLRRDLLRALEEGYSKEYQDLIRKYFELLAE